MKNFKNVGLIPVRLNSKRLPKKALLEIDGLPMIIHTMKRSMLSKKLDYVAVCSDSKIIETLVKKYNGNFIKTSSKHKNGTERIAEASAYFKSELIIDIQGDEPLINPTHIDKLIDFHHTNKNYDIVLPHLLIKNNYNENIVKLADSKGKILYFSRNSIPFSKKKNIKLKKHLSIISFIPSKLKKFASIKQSYLEKLESIELMRAIENNFNIGTFKLNGDSFAIDVKDDYILAKRKLSKDKFRKFY